MNDTRARFEEIWPVPRRIYWSESRGEYLPNDDNMQLLVDQCIEWDARLDTFTRCQETTDVYVSLVDEMVKEMEILLESAYDVVPSSTSALIIRAKKELEK